MDEVCAIPTPTPEELEQLRAEARRVMSLAPGPDEYEQLARQMSILAETGGRWVP